MWPNFRMKNCIYYNLTLIFRIVSHSILKLLLKISHRDNSWIKLLIETEKKWFISIWQTILVILNGGFVSFLRIYSFLIAFLELFCWWKYSLSQAAWRSILWTFFMGAETKFVIYIYIGCPSSGKKHNEQIHFFLKIG